MLKQFTSQTSAKWSSFCLFLLFAISPVSAELLPYKVRFLHIPERGMRGELEEHSESQELRAQPPPTEALLLARGERDRKALLEIFRARGYYSATLAIRLAGPEEKRRLIFDFTPGPRYRFGEVTLSAQGVKAPTPLQIGIKPGLPARADYAIEGERALLREVRLRGYPYPAITTRLYSVDPTQALLHVALAVEPGRRATFGPTTIEGLNRVNESYVRGELAYREGAIFTPELLDDTRAALARSGLFSSLALTAPEEVPEDGTLPMKLTLRERKRRTVAMTAGYKTDEGAGAGAQWEHRNLFGGAERLRLKLNWAEQARSAEAGLTKPQFAHTAQQLDVTLRLADEEPEAYASRNVRTAAILSRHWTRTWSSQAGGAVRYTRVDQLDSNDDFLLFSMPLQVTHNTSDDPLDARRGHVLRVDTEPFYDALATDVVFLKSSLRGQRYQALNRDKTWVLAGRATVGGIGWAGRSVLPADELFYAGGGASIRGYAYQSVGPMLDGEPIGGRSLFETSLESRWQLSSKLGCALFADGGSAFASPAPDFNDTLRWGTGVGVRYFTPIGPLRVDIGFPLNRRPDIDKSHQFYVSLGQAF